jgi:hypothetical protein
MQNSNPFQKYKFLDVDEDENIRKIQRLADLVGTYQSEHESMTDMAILQLRADIATLSYQISLKPINDWNIGAIIELEKAEAEAFVTACKEVRTKYPATNGLSTIGDYARKIYKRDKNYLEKMKHQKKVQEIYWELKRKMDKVEKILDSMKNRSPM